MKHGKSHPRIALMTVFIVACTTDFSSSNPEQDTTTDTTADTTTDVDPDNPDVAADMTDVPTDTSVDPVTDVPPPDPVVCTSEDSYWFDVPDGESVTWGCTPSGDCDHLNLWLGFANQTLVAIIGAENIDSDGTEGFLVTLIDPESMDSVDEGRITMPYEASNTWYNFSGGSIVQNQPDAMSLIISSQTHVSGIDLDVQNLRVITLGGDSGLLDYDVHTLLNGTMPADEAGKFTQPRALRTSWGEYFVFVMLEEETPLFMNNQLFGATISGADFLDSSINFLFATRFQPLQPTRTQAYFPGLPDEMDGAVVMPYLHLDMATDIGSYHAGLWIQDDSISPGSPANPIESMELMSSCAFDSQLAGVSYDGRERYGMAALCSANRFSMSGVEPPYELNSATIDMLVPDTGIDGTAVLDIFESTWRDLEFIDLLDPQALLDPSREIYHYVNVFYTGDTATMRIDSFSGDGRYAMEPGGYYELSADSPTLSAFDAAIRHETGRIFLAHMESPADGSYGSIGGFYITPVVCE